MGNSVEALLSDSRSFSAPVGTPEDSGEFKGFTRKGLVNATGNLLLAGCFFSSAFTLGGHHDFSAANIIWSVGAFLMGFFSLVRTMPKATMVNLRSLSATGGMLIIPAMVQLTVPSTGIVQTVGIGIEIAGMLFTQVARVFLGRSFGLLPANRGVVSNGPFRLMRHPIYAGWLLLSIGYAICYPSALNVLINVITLPFMMWRIEQEEELLMADPEYRAYAGKVRYRLIPGLL